MVELFLRFPALLQGFKAHTNRHKKFPSPPQETRESLRGTSKWNFSKADGSAPDWIVRDSELRKSEAPLLSALEGAEPCDFAKGRASVLCSYGYPEDEHFWRLLAIWNFPVQRALLSGAHAVF